MDFCWVEVRFTIYWPLESIVFCSFEIRSCGGCF